MQLRGRAGQQNYGESTQSSFVFLSGGKEDREKAEDREKEKEKEKEGAVLPEFIVAGCGRTVREVYRERETTVTNEKRRRRREEGEQQFD